MSLTALTRAIRLGAPHPALRAAGSRAASPSAGRRGARFGRRGGALPQWTPAALGAKLKLWLDQRDLVVTGAGYSNWGDQSPGGTVDFVQTSDTSRPAASSVNGFACPDFDGSDNFMQSASALSAVVSAASWHVFAVVNIDSIGTNNANAFLNDCVVADLSQFWGIFLRDNAGTITVYGYQWDGAAKAAGAAGFTTGGTVLIEASYDGTTIRCRVGAGATATQVAGNITTLTGTLRVGGLSAAGAQNADGRVASVVVCNEALSAAEQTSARAYLGAKYGAAT